MHYSSFRAKVHDLERVSIFLDIETAKMETEGQKMPQGTKRSHEELEEEHGDSKIEQEEDSESEEDNIGPALPSAETKE